MHEGVRRKSSLFERMKRMKDEMIMMIDLLYIYIYIYDDEITLTSIMISP